GMCDAGKDAKVEKEKDSGIDARVTCTIPRPTLVCSMYAVAPAAGEIDVEDARNGCILNSASVVDTRVPPMSSVAAPSAQPIQRTSSGTSNASTIPFPSTEVFQRCSWTANT